MAFLRMRRYIPFFAFGRLRRCRLVFLTVLIMIIFCFYLAHETQHKSLSETPRNQFVTWLPDPTTHFEFLNTEPSSKACLKEVLIYGNLTDMAIWPELSGFYKYFSKSQVYGHPVYFKCPLHKCTIKFFLGTAVDLFQGRDAVIFGMLPKVFQGRISSLLEKIPEPEQTWFYYSTETPLRVMQWIQDERLGELRYHKIMTYRRDSDIYLPFGYYKPFDLREKHSNQSEQSIDYTQNKSREIAWMGSNCAQIFWPRYALMDRLKLLAQVYDYGKCGRLQCLPPRSKKCAESFRKFYFYLVFANSECHEYITEKFWWNSLMHDIIPVVYGAPKSDFAKLAPPKSFIHVSDYSHVGPLGEYLQKLIDEPPKYNEYFKWKEQGEIINTFPVRPDTLCDIIAHLFVGKEQKLKLLGNSTWYNGCRRTPDKRIFPPYFPKQQKWDYLGWSPWKPEEGLTEDVIVRRRIAMGKF